jgi:hypothetical protein
MTDYTKSTNFASKDSLPSGDPLKIVKGTEINTEFDNIATAISTKYDSSFTIPITSGGTGATTASAARTALGVVIGTNVQAWDADLDSWAGKTAPSGTVVGTSDTQTLTNKTLTSPTIGGTPVMNASVLSSGTAVASTSGTSIDFTGIPSWVKRITVMFNGVSNTGASSSILVQLGTSSGVTTSGYVGASSLIASTVTSQNYTTGFGSRSQAAAAVLSGSFVITLISGNTWTAFGVLGNSNTATTVTSGGSVALAATLDRVRITAENGTDTFDAGSINILYE